MISLLQSDGKLMNSMTRHILILPKIYSLLFHTSINLHIPLGHLLRDQAALDKAAHLLDMVVAGVEPSYDAVR